MSEESGRGGLKAFFERFLWIFYAPSRVFSDIEGGRASWWQPCAWIAALNLVIALASLPVQRVLMELRLQETPEEQYQGMVESMDKLLAAGVVAAPIMALVLALIVSLIAYVLVSILASNANFKRFFTIVLYSTLITSAGYLLSTLIVAYGKGPGSIQSPQDARFSFGLGFLAPPENHFLEAVFMNIDLFAIWTLVLMVMGLMHVFQMARRQAIICVVPLWILSVLISLLSLRFEGA